MGYEVFIEKKSNQKIGLDKWNNFLETNKDFEKRNYFEGTNPRTGEVLKFIAPNSGMWKSDKWEVPFLYNENTGKISVTNPNKEILKKMLEIAVFFEAEVVGFEGEKYNKPKKNGGNSGKYFDIQF